MFFDVFNQNVCTFLLSEEENKIKKEEKITFHDWAYKFEGVFRKDFCSVIVEDDDDERQKDDAFCALASVSTRSPRGLRRVGCADATFLMVRSTRYEATKN